MDSPTASLEEEQLLFERKMWTSQLQDTLLSRLRNLRTDEDTSDITFLVGSAKTPFPAHRVIVGTSSEFFRALLYGGMKESRETNITLPEVSPEAFCCILDFLYTGTVSIPNHSSNDLKLVVDVLMTADRFGLDELARDASLAVNKTMSPTNVVGICLAAKEFNNDRLVQQSRAFMIEYADELMSSDDILKLPFDEFLAVVQSDDISASEIDIFRGILRWCEINRSEREEAAKALVEHVRLGFIEFHQLATEIEKSGLVDFERLFCISKWFVCKETMSEQQLAATDFKKRGPVEVILKLWGGGGGGGQYPHGNHGGAGGYAEAHYFLRRTEHLLVTVGGGGCASNQGTPGDQTGGFPNGGCGKENYTSGGGGGSSHIRKQRDGEVIIGAGGGGGGPGGQSFGSGGGGGGGTYGSRVGKGGNGGGGTGAQDGARATSGVDGGGGGGGMTSKVGGASDHGGQGGNGSDTTVDMLANSNGAAGRRGQAHGGGGGGGGCASFNPKYIVSGSARVINATTNAAVNTSDPHSGGANPGKGGEHGGGKGGHGRVAIVLDDRSVVFDQAGEFDFSFSQLIAAAESAAPSPAPAASAAKP